MQETEIQNIQHNESLQQLDTLLQQLEVETFEIENITDTKAILGGTCSSTTSSTTSKVI